MGTRAPGRTGAVEHGGAGATCGVRRSRARASAYSDQSWMTASMLLPSGSYTNAA